MAVVSAKKVNKRKGVRFKSDRNAVAFVDTEMKSRKFDPSTSALVFSESFKGCGLIVLTTDALKVGDQCRVKIGLLPVLMGEVAWREKVDKDILRIGIHFLE